MFASMALALRLRPSISYTIEGRPDQEEDIWDLMLNHLQLNHIPRLVQLFHLGYTNLFFLKNNYYIYIIYHKKYEIK